ncbi:MAG: peptidoglycan DD-metalloendopeptidase family protein, partial [Pseudomonadota bacterium]
DQGAQVAVLDTPNAPVTDGGWSPALAEAAIQRATGLDEEGNLAAPPSANDPLPDEPQGARDLASPDLSQYQTGAANEPQPQPRPAAVPQPAPEPVEVPETEVAAATPVTRPVSPGATPGSLTRPVQGPIVIGFRSNAGGSRNDGVDFAAPPGAPVLAADDGEVALVSQSLGGLGTIVLLRHSSGLLTVYGRVDGVTLTKGALVTRGQQIGVVATPPSGGEGRMHFEVRRGAESLNPEDFLAG